MIKFVARKTMGYLIKKLIAECICKKATKFILLFSLGGGEIFGLT
jgi:hypothetical protein